jgi:CBS-domain-containing membrane protein
VCSVDDRLSDVMAAEADGAAAPGLLVVTDSNRVVIGVIESGSSEADALEVGDVMIPAPPTARASAHPGDELRRMEEKALDYVVITDPEGRFLGILDRSLAAAAVVADAIQEQQRRPDD